HSELGLTAASSSPHSLRPCRRACSSPSPTRVEDSALKTTQTDTLAWIFRRIPGHRSTALGFGFSIPALWVEDFIWSLTGVGSQTVRRPRKIPQMKSLLMWGQTFGQRDKSLS